MSDSATRSRAFKLMGGGLIAVLLLSSFVWFVRTMMSSKGIKQSRQVQVVQIIRPPPPPPEEPPPPPPPEKNPEPLPKDQPEPTPKDDAPPPSQPLGIDADASAGGDAFGLAARHGGSDLIGGDGSSAFAWFSSRLKDAVYEKLSGESCIKSRKFSASARLWLEADGKIREAKLSSTTGNRDLDKCIETALNSGISFNEAPPIEMPQPISIKIASHS